MEDRSPAHCAWAKHDQPAQGAQGCGQSGQLPHLARGGRDREQEAGAHLLRHLIFVYFRNRSFVHQKVFWT